METRVCRSSSRCSMGNTENLSVKRFLNAQWDLSRSPCVENVSLRMDEYEIILNKFIKLMKPISLSLSFQRNTKAALITTLSFINIFRERKSKIRKSEFVVRKVLSALRSVHRSRRCISSAGASSSVCGNFPKRKTKRKLKKVTEYLYCNSR